MPEQSVLVIGADDATGDKIQAMGAALSEPLEWRRVDGLLDGLRLLQDRSFDVIVSDLFPSGGKGLSTLENLKRHAPVTPIIALCRATERAAGVQAVRHGAWDFYCYEDPDVGGLLRLLEGALTQARNESERTPGAERRTSARFPCKLSVSYQTLEQPIVSGQGASETLNVSSKGLLFTSDAKFNPGQLVQVSIDWPARLENQIPLKLVAEGRVVRNGDGLTAMTIDKYEFRTRRAPKPPDVKPAAGPGPGKK